MLFNARTLTGIAVAGCMLALLSSCTTGSGVEDPSASGNVSDLALEDFSGRAAIMASWELVCPPVSLDPVVDQFANIHAVEYGSELNKFDIAPKGIWNAVCYAEANEPSSGEFFSVALSMDAFNSNMDAFEHYEGSAKFTAERRNSVEIDHEVQLGEGSAWAESRITAQETPSPQRDGQSMTAVALLGDFYTVEIQVGFHPETAEAAGCESIGNEACAVTATSVAEFFATSDYLETLHADIESALDEGS